MVSEQGEAIGGYPCHPPSHLPAPPGVGRRQGLGRFGGLSFCRIPSPPPQVVPSPSGRPGLRGLTQQAGPPVLLMEEPWPACPPPPGLPPQPRTPRGRTSCPGRGMGYSGSPRGDCWGCGAGSCFPGNVRGGLQGCEGGADVPAVPQSPPREGLRPPSPACHLLWPWGFPAAALSARVAWAAGRSGRGYSQPLAWKSKAARGAQSHSANSQHPATAQGSPTPPPPRSPAESLPHWGPLAVNNLPPLRPGRQGGAEAHARPAPQRAARLPSSGCAAPPGAEQLERVGPRCLRPLAHLRRLGSCRTLLWAGPPVTPGPPLSPHPPSPSLWLAVSWWVCRRLVRSRWTCRCHPDGHSAPSLIGRGCPPGGEVVRTHLL